MREIKFRAWDTQEKKMSLPFDVKKDWGDFLIDFGDWSADGASEKMEWLQFTGLLDKNGKEIYGGDLVRDNKGRLFEVKWNDLYAAFGLKDWSLGKESAPLRGLHPATQLEIIGNIYSNPELLTNTTEEG